MISTVGIISWKSGYKSGYKTSKDEIPVELREAIPTPDLHDSTTYYIVCKMDQNHNRTYSLIIGGKATIPIDSFKLTDNINIWIKKTI